MKAFIITCLSSILSVSILNAAAINIETSGDKGKDAGDVSVHYLDKIGNIGLQNTKVGIPTPDLIQDSATLSGENTFRKIDCKTIFIVGRCVIHVFGGLNVERFLPSPNSVTPPELIITDASIKETYFSVFFDTKTTPSLSKGGSVYYYSSGRISNSSGIAIYASGGDGIEQRRNGGNGGNVFLAHCGRIFVSVDGGDGYSESSNTADPKASTHTDGGLGGNAGSVSIKCSPVPVQRYALGRNISPSIDFENLMISANGGNGGDGRYGWSNHWNAGKGGTGGSGGTLLIDTSDLPVDFLNQVGTSSGWVSAAGGEGGNGGDGDCSSGSKVGSGDGGNAGNGGSIAQGFALPEISKRSGGKAGSICGNSGLGGLPGYSQASHSVVANAVLNQLPSIPFDIASANSEWIAYGNKSEIREVRADGWRCKYYTTGPSIDLDINVAGGGAVSGMVGIIDFPILLVAIGNETNKIELNKNSLISFQTGTRPNQYGINRTFIESRYFFPAPYNLIVTNTCELEPLMLLGSTINSSQRSPISVINSPLESNFQSQKARLIISYSFLGEPSFERQVIVAQRIKPTLQRYPILGADDKVPGGVKVFPPDHSYAPKGMIIKAIRAPDDKLDDDRADNLHISDIPDPQLPGLWDYGNSKPYIRNPINGLAGCQSCIHIHWKWDSALDNLVGFYQNYGFVIAGVFGVAALPIAPPPPIPFGSPRFIWDDAQYNGQYIIPEKSSQSMEVALTDGLDFKDENELRSNRLDCSFPRQSNTNKMAAVLLAKSKDANDSFFKFGFFVRTVLAEVDQTSLFQQEETKSPQHLNWGGGGPTFETTAIKFAVNSGSGSDGANLVRSVDPASRHFAHLFYAGLSQRVSRAWITSTNSGSTPSPVSVSSLDHFLHISIPPDLTGARLLTDKVLLLETKIPLAASEVSKILTNSWIYRVPDADYVNLRNPVDVVCGVGKLDVNLPASVTGILEERIGEDRWQTNTVLLPGASFRSVPVSGAQAEPRFFRVRIPPDVTSAVVTVPPGIAPSVSVQPVSVVLKLGHSATFSVEASGSIPLTYQWLHNDVPITGGTKPILRLNSIGETDAGDYRVVISNSTGSATSDIATLSIETDVVNAAPVLTAVGVPGFEDTTVVFQATDFTSKYSDIENTALASLKVVTLPATGVLKLLNVAVTAGQVIPAASLGNLSYEPALNENGAKTFTVSASDGELSSAVATVTMTLAAVNDAPTISTISNQTTLEDTATGAIAFTVSDVETAVAALTVTASSSNTGIVANTGIALGGSGASRTITVTPVANANGTSTITVTVNDGALTTTTTFVLTVTAVKDVPVATAQSVTVTEDSATTITLAGTDVEGATLTYTVVTQPLKGVLNGAVPNLTYTPNANATGSDSFTFKVNDGTVDSVVATVMITISAVNDAPVLAAVGVSGTEDTTHVFQATDFTSQYSDIENTALASVTVVTLPATGVLKLSNVAVTAGQVIPAASLGNLSYEPALNENGAKTFTVSASDGELSSAVATVTMTLAAVNDVPVATAQSVTVIADTVTAITLSGTDVEGSTLSYKVTTQPSMGVLGGVAPNLTYTPNANATGSDSFTFVIKDGTAESAAATVTIVFQPPHGEVFSLAIGQNVLPGRINGKDVPGAGRLEKPGDTDEYLFEGFQGQQLYAGEILGDGTGLIWECLAPSGVRLWQEEPLGDIGAPSESRDVGLKILPSAGLYRIVVRGIGSYGFRLVPMSGSVPELRVEVPVDGNAFRIRLGNVGSESITLEVSDDLRRWTAVHTPTIQWSQDGTLILVVQGGGSERFYRIRQE